MFIIKWNQKDAMRFKTRTEALEYIRHPIAGDFWSPTEDIKIVRLRPRSSPAPTAPTATLPEPAPPLRGKR